MSAPVGHACTHSPQATQVDCPMGSSKSNTILEECERYAMPMTSLTCTSRQARTHRLHWMHALRLTRIAGWLASGPQRSSDGKRLSVMLTKSAWLQKCDVGSCEVARSG